MAVVESFRFVYTDLTCTIKRRYHSPKSKVASRPKSKERDVRRDERPMRYRTRQHLDSTDARTARGSSSCARHWAEARRQPSHTDWTLDSGHRTLGEYGEAPQPEIRRLPLTRQHTTRSPAPARPVKSSRADAGRKRPAGAPQGVLAPPAGPRADQLLLAISACSAFASSSFCLSATPPAPL